MREISDNEWNSITPAQEGEFNDLPAGGYIVQITKVEDREQQEGLLVWFDIVRGDFTGYARDTNDRAGFWPLKAWVSTKDSAIRFFKGFVTSVEMSTPSFRFNRTDPQCLVGKYFGAVLGEEEYRKNNGEIGTRPYTAQKRTVQAIQKGDFKVPELKKYKPKGNAPAPAPAYTAPQHTQPQPYAPQQMDFAELTDDDGELPF